MTTKWAHLPNAKHIDRVIASIKTHPKIWAKSWVTGTDKAWVDAAWEAAMEAAGIGTGVHYPVIHLFALYRRMGWKEGDFPNAELIGRSILTLPLFPAMGRDDVARAVEALAWAVRRNLKS